MSLIKISTKGSALSCSELDANFDYVLDLANATGELDCAKINQLSLATCLLANSVIIQLQQDINDNSTAIGEVAQDLTESQTTLQTSINNLITLINNQNATIADLTSQLATLTAGFNSLSGTVDSFNSRLLSVEGRLTTLEDVIASGIIVVWSGAIIDIPASWGLCLLGDSQVLLADGSVMEIQDIVNNKLSVEVMSYNVLSGALERKRVINWFKNKVQDRSIWYKLKIARGNGYGPKSLTLTKDHPVWIVDKGWTKTEDVNTGDKVLRYEPTFTDEGRQAILGMYLSDGYISPEGVFKISQGDCHKDYIEYLSNKLELNINTGVNKEGFGKGFNYNTVQLSLKSMWPEVLDNLVYGNKVTKYTLEQLGPVGIAHWYMGDGNLQWDKRTDEYRSQFHTEGFSKEEVRLIADYFETLLGERPFIYDRNPYTDGEFIRLGKQGTYRLMQLISQYVIPSMQYKLLPEFKGKFIDNFNLLTKDLVTFIVEKKSVSELHASKKNRKIYDIKYDIEVEDNHSFIANGFLVHNCNGTNGTPDLRDRFIIAAGNNYAVNSVGGSSSHTHSITGTTGGTSLTINQMPSHSHGVNDPGHQHVMFAGDNNRPSNSFIENSNNGNEGPVPTSVSVTNISIQFTGANEAHSHSFSATTATTSNIPPYYALAYIMRI